MRSGTTRGLRAAIVAVAASLLVIGTSFTGGAAAFADDLTFTTVPTITVTPDASESPDGSVSVGDLLTETATRIWSPRPTDITFDWYRNGVALGMQEETYQITAEDVGQQITFEEIGTLAGYADGVASSTPIVPLPRAAITGLAVSTMDPKAGVPITASYTSTDPVDATVTYQWSNVEGEQLISLGTGSSYTPTESQDNAYIELVATATAPGYATGQAGLGLNPVTPSILHPRDVQIYGTPVVGVPMPIGNSWYPAASSYSNIQWSVNGKQVAGATNLTFTPTAGDVGKALTVTETANLDGYAPVTYTTAASATVTRDFTKIPIPTITGTPAIGSTLTAHVGKWSPTPTEIYYQWQIGGYDVGDNNSTFTPAYDDWAGQPVTVIVTAETEGYGPVASPPSAPTADLASGQVSAGTVTIGGAGINDIAVANIKGWADDASLTYKWTVNGVAQIYQGVTYQQIPDDPALIGKTVTVTVTESETGENPVTVTASAVIGTGHYRFTGESLPIIGTAAVGNSLTVDESAWTPTPTVFSVHWYLVSSYGPKLIGTKSTYTIPTEYSGEQIWAVATVSGPALQSATNESYTETVVKGTFATQPTPTITGTLAVGSKLTAHHGTWAPTSDVTYTYRWFEQDAADATATPITGATHSTLTVGHAELGELISVQVTAHHYRYIPATTTSVVSTPILN